MSFQSLGFSAELLRGTRVSGSRASVPMQAQTLPLILEGRGVSACADGRRSTVPMIAHRNARLAG
jgi:superfamily II DNA/RNA helicase